NIYIGAMQSTFEKRPEVFQSVRMDVTFCVANCMVDNSTVVIAFKIIIRHKRIGTDCRTLSNVFTNVAAKFWSAGVGNYFQDDLGMFVSRCPLQDALHGSFLESSVSNACAFILVHVASLCADIGFVCLT